jgi:hypothetical protein
LIDDFSKLVFVQALRITIDHQRPRQASSDVTKDQMFGGIDQNVNVRANAILF